MSKDQDDEPNNVYYEHRPIAMDKKKDGDTCSDQSISGAIRVTSRMHPFMLSANVYAGGIDLLISQCFNVCFASSSN